jgi:putative membrane protein
MHDWSAGSWVFMSVGMLVFWALVVWLIVLVLRGRFSDRDLRMASDILDERLARGETSVEEYERRRNSLRGGSPAAPAADR